MKRTKTLLFAVTLALSALVTVPVITGTGCASSQVDPGSEAFVVEAEKDIRTSFKIVDAFLQWEHLNRTTAGPDVTAAADKLRVDFPKWHASAQTVLRAYKTARTPESRGDVTTWLNTLTTAMLEAVKYLPPAEASKAYAAASSR